MVQIKESIAVAVCKTHKEAEQVVKDLQHSGFDMKKLSIVGKDYHEEDEVVGYYNLGDSMKKWGGLGAFWGGLWGFIFGAGLFFIPGIGQVVMAGPIISSLIGTLEGAVVFGGISALGAALINFGIPQDSVLKYETELKADKYLVITNGTSSDIDQAREIMSQNNKVETSIHN